MVDYEDVILDISNLNTKRSTEIKSNNIKNQSKQKIKSNKNRIQINNEKLKKKNSKSISSEDTELFKNYSYSGQKNANTNKKMKELIYPVKIKKMEKTDVIIKEEEPKKDPFVICNNSNTDSNEFYYKTNNSHDNSDHYNINTNTHSNKINESYKKEKKKAKMENDDNEKKYICNFCKKSYNIKNSFQKTTRRN